MDFSSDANANFEGLLAVHRGICIPQMAEKTSPDAPPNCTAASLSNCRLCQVFLHRLRFVYCIPGKIGVSYRHEAR